MSDLKAALREAFEAEGYDVADVSDNRTRYRVELLGQEPAAELRPVVEAAVDDGIVGLDVSAESVDGAEGVRTVVSFRYRD